TATRRCRSRRVTCSSWCTSWAAVERRVAGKKPEHEGSDMATLMEAREMTGKLVIAGRPLRSRLMVGTGKYRSNAEMVDSIEASGAEVVTVAVRRVDLDRSKEEGILHHLDPERYLLLPNTAG